MRPGHIFVTSFAAFPLAGWPLLVHPSYRRFPLVCRFVLSGGAGAVLISFWMTVFALVGLAWQLLFLLLLATATAFLLRLLLKSERFAETESDASPPSSLGEKLATLTAMLAVLWAFVAAASGAATSIDLLLFWGAKAQAFALAKTIDVRFLRDPFLDYMHASYPPLVTNALAFAAMAAGRFAWGAATLTFPLLLAGLALALPGVLKLAAPRTVALLSSALIISAFGFLGNKLDVAGNGDPPLWFFETLAAAVLIGRAGLTRSGQLLAGLLLAGAAEAKVEGLPFVMVAGVLFLLLRKRDVQVWSSSLLVFSPVIFSLGAWFVFGAAAHLFIGYRGYGRFSDTHWNRLPAVLECIGNASWSVGFALPFLVPLLALLVARKSRLAILPVGVSLALALFFLYTYLTHETDPSLFIKWSAGRVFSPIAAFLAVASLPRREPD